MKPPGTADVLVAAYKHLKMSPAQTMLILEQLYLGKK
jgi:DNA topoisomerase IA